METWEKMNTVNPQILGALERYTPSKDSRTKKTKVEKDSLPQKIVAPKRLK